MTLSSTEQPGPVGEAAAPYRKVLVGFDGSAGSRRALAQALRLATYDGAAVHVLSVIEHLPHYAATVGEVDETREAAERHVALLQAEARRVAEQQGLDIETHVRAGHAAKVLVDYAREGRFDLLVVGHSGHSGIWGAFLGTTSDKAVRHAPCSVLVVR